MKQISFVCLISLVTCAAAAHAGLTVAEVDIGKENEKTTKSFSVMESDFKKAESKAWPIKVSEPGVSCALLFRDNFGTIGAELSCVDARPVAHEFSVTAVCLGKDKAFRSDMAITTVRKGKLQGATILGLRCYQP